MLSTENKRQRFSSVNPNRKLTLTNSCEASEQWGFNCGPGALCGLLDLTPEELRPHLGVFDKKRYTNPTMMSSFLQSLGVQFRSVFKSEREPKDYMKVVYPEYGLVRIQWSGPWTSEGVPIFARYRNTHWIGFNKQECQVFDINAMRFRGWIGFDTWRFCMVPYILSESNPKADGKWWPTHCWELV